MKIGIDIGGSHIGIGLINNNGSIVLKIEKFIKDKTNIKEQIEEFITETVIEMGLTNEIESIGIAIPGTVTDNKIIKAVNLGIEEYDLASNLEKILKIPVKLKNDAKCAALAEQRYGELANYENSIFLCIGTGVGGAVIHDGKLLEPDGVPGFEFSHTIIQKDGELCNCGKRGCFETYASLKRFKQKVSDRFDLNTLSGKVIRKFIEENPDNQMIKEMIKEYVDYLSIGISNIINIFEPDAICIGGSFSEYGNIFFEPLKEALLQGNLLFNKRNEIIIKYAKLKNDAGIIGAALI
ncbi:MAG: ROK family protein [Clostridia bacterium]|nr:ROK family protein [Clostridia bacterium]